MKYKIGDTVIVCDNVVERMYHKNTDKLASSFIDSSNRVFKIDDCFNGVSEEWKTDFDYYYKLSNGYVYIEEVLSLYDEQRLQLLELEKVL